MPLLCAAVEQFVIGLDMGPRQTLSQTTGCNMGAAQIGQGLVATQAYSNVQFGTDRLWRPVRRPFRCSTLTGGARRFHNHGLSLTSIQRS